jgi:protein gp37
MENSKIEWTNHTFNPWIGCPHVSPGCDHCYAETQNAFRKWNGGTSGPHAPRKRTSVGYWKNPIKWNAAARAFKRQHRHRPRVFCASLADAFDNQVQPEWRQDLFALIRECYELDWLVLTKRVRLGPWVPERVARRDSGKPDVL